jgi:hypothetical protein
MNSDPAIRTANSPQILPRLLILCSILVLWSATAIAQFTTARLSGIVSDSSGGVLSSAQVTVSDLGTGYTKTTRTGDTGEFLFPSLSVGTYRLSVSMPGFTTYIQNGIALAVGESVTQNVQLRIGSVAQNVVVTANSQLVTTDSSMVGQLIPQQDIVQLPLNGRAVQQLVFLAAGTTNVTANYCAANCEGGVFPTEQYAKVNGATANGVYYLMDGVNYNDTYINTNIPFPNPDAIEEFNLLTGNMSANYGNAIGGVVNVVTKSGTNSLHGDVFEFLRNNIFDAADYFSPIVNPLHQNQFGASLGGRIIKDRLFFFGSYQGTRFTTANDGQIAFVPNANERTGDFSDPRHPARQSNHRQSVSQQPGPRQPDRRLHPESDPVAQRPQRSTHVQWRPRQSELQRVSGQARPRRR